MRSAPPSARPAAGHHLSFRPLGPWILEVLRLRYGRCAPCAALRMTAFVFFDAALRASGAHFHMQCCLILRGRFLCFGTCSHRSHLSA